MSGMLNELLMLYAEMLIMIFVIALIKIIKKGYKKMNEKMDLWWSKLEISEKERIARKAQNNVEDSSLWRYPACYNWWNGLDTERKEAIYDHVKNDHRKEGNQDKEGQSMSY